MNPIYWEYSRCLIHELPMMGEAGWEAFAIAPHPSAASTLEVCAYLKRPCSSMKQSGVPPVSMPPVSMPKDT